MKGDVKAPQVNAHPAIAHASREDTLAAGTDDEPGFVSGMPSRTLACRDIVWLPGRWPSLNAVHDAGVWAKVRLKRRWQDSARLLIRVAKLRPVGRAILHYEHHRPDWRGDPSNYAAEAMKIVEDALVEEGVLGGDSFSVIAGFTHTFRVVPKKPGLLVRIEEVS